VPIFIFIIVLALQLFLAVPVFAEGEKVDEIIIRGNKRIEAPAILNAIKLKPGDTLSHEKTSADIRAIYKMGHFQDIQVSLEESSRQ